MSTGFGIMSLLLFVLMALPGIVLFVLVIYALFLAITALKIYIRKNS